MARAIREDAVDGRRHWSSEARCGITHAGRQMRLDKPSRCVHVGDGLTFMVGPRLIDLRVEGLGERRGPAEEARALYALVETG